MHNVARFFETMQNSRVAFIGTGVTNGDIIRLFRKKGIDVTLLDRKNPEQLGKVYTEFESLGVKFCLGDSYLDFLTDYDVVFRSPGMYYHNEKLQEARKKGVVITSEMEVFFSLCPCKIYAVTGSDGKTTTTTLISEFLSRAGFRVHKGGNIGRALLPIIEEIHEDDVAVVELSSFQLLSMRQSPDVAYCSESSGRTRHDGRIYLCQNQSDCTSGCILQNHSESGQRTHYASGINGSRHADYVFPQNQTGIRHLSAGRRYAVLYQRRQGHTGCPHE